MKKYIESIVHRNYTLYVLAKYFRNIVHRNRVVIKSNGIYRFHKDIRGTGNKVIIGKKTVVNNSKLIISGSNNTVEIGDQLRIGKNSSFRIVEKNNVNSKAYGIN